MLKKREDEKEGLKVIWHSEETPNIFHSDPTSCPQMRVIKTDLVEIEFMSRDIDCDEAFHRTTEKLKIIRKKELDELRKDSCSYQGDCLIEELKQELDKDPIIRNYFKVQYAKLKRVRMFDNKEA